MDKLESEKEINKPKDEENIDYIVKRMITLDGFTKEAVSNILKSKNEPNEQISLKYLRSLNFKKLDLVDAYRKLAYFLFITGDSQDIDIVHERFCKVYCEHNSTFLSTDKCYTLVTAFIMLNSDLHSKKISNKMTLEQFIVNITNAFSHHEFDEEMLRNIYKSIKQKEIKHINSDSRMRKRSNEVDLNAIVDSKKTKNDSENIQNFGFHIVKMKSLRNSAFQIFENKSWKQYFSSVDNLTLSLYKHEDFRQFFDKDDVKDRISMDKNDFSEIAYQFIHESKPIEELGLHHAYATTLICDNTKCELFLIDNSKYLFKFKDAMLAENWTHSVNYAAGLLSKPPLWTVQNIDNTKTIIQHKWSSEISKYNLKEQRERTEQQMKTFENDLNYLKENPSKKSDYKVNLKYVSRNFERYQTYHRTLNMAKGKLLKVIPAADKSNDVDDAHNCLSTWMSSTNSETSNSLICIASSSRKHSSNISSIVNTVSLNETETH